MSDQSKDLRDMFGGFDQAREDFLQRERTINRAEMSPFTRGLMRSTHGLVGTVHGLRGAEGAAEQRAGEAGVQHDRAHRRSRAPHAGALLSLPEGTQHHLVLTAAAATVSERAGSRLR